MAELREDSLLFSLKEIFDSEKGRVRDEELTRERERERRAADEAERERIRRDGEERVQREVEARRRIERQAADEHTAKLAAMEHAVVERARVSAELDAARMAAELERKHALRLADLENGVKRRRYHALSWIFGVSWVLTTLAAAGAHYGVIQPQQARVHAGYEQAFAKQNERHAAGERLLASSEARRSALFAELMHAQERIASLERQLAAPKPKAGRLPPTRGPIGDPPPRGPAFDKNDPLNPSLR
jgi:hypothetical protein